MDLELHGEKLLAVDILVLASPTWLGQPSSIAQRVLERMDAVLSETDDEGRPVAYNRVAGFVVTGNEDGAHRVIANLAQCLIDIAYTVPGQAWTYWNKGPGPGEEVYPHDRGNRVVRQDGQGGRGQPRCRGSGARSRPMSAPPE